MTPFVGGRDLTHRLKNGKRGRRHAKAVTKSKVATELFKSPAATPVKASSIRKHKPVRDDANLLTPVKSVQKARRAIDFMEFLDEKVGNTPVVKQVHFSGKSFSAARQGKPVELKTKKQTKSAKRKSLKRSSSSRTPRKARRGSRNLARAMTPAKEPRQEKPLARESRETREPNGLLKLLAFVPIALIGALAGTRSLAARTV